MTDSKTLPDSTVCAAVALCSKRGGLRLRFDRRLLGSILAGGLVVVGLGSCTMAEAGMDTPAPELPRFPSLRLVNRPVVEIGDLLTEPASAPVDSTVAISGMVVARSALLDGWLYQVQDKTGQMWILTYRSEPTVGELAVVEGIVKRETIVVETLDASEVYLEERTYRRDTGRQASETQGAS